MNINIKAASYELEVTGDQGEVVAAFKGENLDTFINGAALLTNFATLSQLFRKLDTEVEIDGMRNCEAVNHVRRQLDASK